MQSEVLIHPDGGELCVSGTLDADTGKQLVAAMTEVLARFRQPVWHLNLKDAELTDGQSLTFLLECLQLALNQGVRLQLTGLSHEHRMLFRISRLDGLFEIEAMAA
ncbi:MAG: hypothetical protein CVV27_04505 [Candidatus Melainabacteria bacterium HGW-Melainabacteria-1]|nr:MAG: hypothetical protein CVV27_04505 [Candidatus Melainabacteria bacterium HGW-Melainabacteria-1]